MAFVEYFKKIYSLDTLDTRFSGTSNTRSRQTKRDAQGEIDPAKPVSNELDSNGTPPSRWGSAEFYIYYVVFIVVIPLMFKVSYDLSKPSHPNYPKYVGLLSPGWIPGRKVDNSDAQYSTFRDHIPYTFLLLIIHPLLRKSLDYLCSSNSLSSSSSTSGNPIRNALPRQEANTQLNRRVDFDLYFGLIFLSALHGFSALKVVSILYINFFLATRLPKQYVPATTWIFNIGILFSNELCSGYRFAAIAETFRPWSTATESGIGRLPLKNWGSWLDSYGGLIPRWEILFNFTVLRLISFNLDYKWSLDRSGASPVEVRTVDESVSMFGTQADGDNKKQPDLSDLPERERVSTPAQSDDYSLRNYIAYTLYAPLYLTGPILTFNDYISQLRYTPRSITTSRTVLYGIRFLVALLTMEVMLHFIYAVAISKAQPAWETYTPFQLSMLGYFNLHIIWLKLLLPWRFFRFWALLDGIDPPENMVRCMSDNYSALAFWRGWHRSFNRWIVRYIYIPLGGSGGSGANGYLGKARSITNFLAVFTFVAIWHDINLRLLTWGWLITLFILPEVLAGFLFPKGRWQNHKEAYRVICGIGAVGNILMMMAANLVGFAIGIDGLRGLVHGIFGSYSGLVFFASACTCLFVGVQVMFETRAEEQRRGIRMKC